jgi:hypothetical protein
MDGRQSRVDPLESPLVNWEENGPAVLDEERQVSPNRLVAVYYVLRGWAMSISLLT